MEIVLKQIESDKVLLEQAVAGDKKAFGMLVNQHQTQIRGTVRSMLGDVAEVDDVAQEVFIRFYHSIHQFKGEARLATYLTRIAINLSLNELNRRKRKSRIIPLFRKQEDGKEKLVIPNTAQFLLQDRYEDKQHIEVAVKSLSPDFKAVVVLRLVQGYSVKETAEILDLPMGTVASRLARAQKQLIRFFKNNQ